MDKAVDTAPRRRRRRVTNDQFMIEQMPQDAIGPTVAPWLELNDQIGGHSCHRRHRLTNGGQLRPNHAGQCSNLASVRSLQDQEEECQRCQIIASIDAIRHNIVKRFRVWDRRAGRGNPRLHRIPD
jgi:hypothetical protein